MKTGPMKISFILFAIVLPGFLASPLHALTRGVLLSPTRVVMEGRERAAIVKIINPDAQANTYKISLISIRMDDFGRKIQVKEPSKAEQFVMKMIRFSPRRATLGPKEWQTVRLMVRKPADLAPGEYRAHLKVVPIPDQSSKPVESQDSEGVSINLDVVFSITIPIIVRHGQGNVNIIPGTPSLKKLDKTNTYSLESRLTRQGLHSAYFNVLAFHKSSGADPVKIGELKGLSFYTPNPFQIVNIPLNSLPDLSGGIIELKIQDLETKDKPMMGSWSFKLE